MSKRTKKVGISGKVSYRNTPKTIPLVYLELADAGK
jgi:hypothetical protein